MNARHRGKARGYPFRPGARGNPARRQLHPARPDLPDSPLRVLKALHTRILDPLVFSHEHNPARPREIALALFRVYLYLSAARWLWSASRRFCVAILAHAPPSFSATNGSTAAGR